MLSRLNHHVAGTLIIVGIMAGVLAALWFGDALPWPRH